MTGKALENWADDFMFPAERSNAKEGPVAYLIQGTPDPLGSIAVAAKAYLGEFFESKDSITDEDRRYYLAEILKTKLKMPMEAVTLHWRIKGVTRSFTHQMVRQRTAAYSQESMRFAVKEDASDAVALPPSLQVFNAPNASPDLHDGHTTLGDVYWAIWRGDGQPFGQDYPAEQNVRQYIRWRETVETIGENYMILVNDGMPAEEARGLLAHNSVTQLNYITNLRNYQDHAGNRLCTQAQFEWRMVWVKMLEAMRGYCTSGSERCFHDSGCDNWQWVEIANIFRPVCYQTGQCEFKAGFDRKCKIRGRVDANADINRPSSEWDQPHNETGEEQRGEPLYSEEGHPVFIGGISPAEWLLDDGAAR